MASAGGRLARGGSLQKKSISASRYVSFLFPIYRTKPLLMHSVPVQTCVTSRGQEIFLHQSGGVSFVAVLLLEAQGPDSFPSAARGGRGPKNRTARRTKPSAQREREVERELVLQRTWS